MVAVLRSKEVRRNVLKIKKVIWTVVMSFRRKAASWNDQFELKRHVTCLRDYQAMKTRGKKGF